MSNAIGPYLVIVWPPPPEYKEHPVDFARQLMEKLKPPVCASAPIAVVKSLDFITLLVEGHISAISGALHHARDNQTKYLIVRPSEPVASFGIAAAEQWIRARQGG